MTIHDLDRAELAAGLKELGADGWLLFDFKGLNPVAGRVLGLGGLGSRRLFVWIPREGKPAAVAHRIELGPMKDFPGPVLPYSRWQELHEALRSVVAGKTAAMEVSQLDAVPYLDRVPWGVVELVKSLGATVVSSSVRTASRTRMTARTSSTFMPSYFSKPLPSRDSRYWQPAPSTPVAKPASAQNGSWMTS